jgi:hypothetical protein
MPDTSTDEMWAPMAWFWAEYLAEDLIALMDSPSLLDPFEFLAARAVLALTLLFTGIANRATQLSGDDLELVRDLISSGGPWLNWCDARSNAADTPEPCRQLARRALRWLLLASPDSDREKQQSPGTGCRVGLKHAQRAVHARLVGP